MAKNAQGGVAGGTHGSSDRIEQPFLHIHPTRLREHLDIGIVVSPGGGSRDSTPYMNC